MCERPARTVEAQDAGQALRPRRRLELDDLAKLCNYFECSLRDLFETVPSPSTLIFAPLLWMGQGIGIRYLGGRTIDVGDHCPQRIGVKRPQRLGRDVAQVRGEGDVIHGAEGMIGR